LLFIQRLTGAELLLAQGCEPIERLPGKGQFGLVLGGPGGQLFGFHCQQPGVQCGEQFAGCDRLSPSLVQGSDPPCQLEAYLAVLGGDHPAIEAVQHRVVIAGLQRLGDHPGQGGCFF